MEVILSSTTAQKHFYGKLTGVLLVALTQMALYGIIFGVGYNQFKDMEMVKNILDGISLDNLIGPFLWYSLLFMIFGILIFCFGSFMWLFGQQSRRYSKSNPASDLFIFRRIHAWVDIRCVRSK